MEFESKKDIINDLRFSNDDLEKCNLISSKFMEQYGHKWGVSLIKNGDCLFHYHKFYTSLF